MSFGNFNRMEVRELAKGLKKLIEPNGAATSVSISEVEVRKHLLNDLGKNVKIEGRADILAILKSHYSDKTVRRLQSKIKKCAVWDTSMCNMPMNDLLELFHNNTEYVNVITSLTFHELLKLANSNRPNNGNAKMLVHSILADKFSEHCITIPLMQTDPYVDTQLLEFCAHHGYALYTYDKRMVLRARSRHISVYNFNQVTSPYTYQPNPTGKDVILDVSVLNSGYGLKDVLDNANELGARKFLITRDFVETLEGENDRESIKKFIYFLLADTKEEYTDYISNNDDCIATELLTNHFVSHDLEQLAKEYDAIIFTSDPLKAFEIKSEYSSAYRFILSRAENAAIQNYCNAQTSDTAAHVSEVITEQTCKTDLNSNTNSESDLNLDPAAVEGNRIFDIIIRDNNIVVPSLGPSTKSHGTRSTHSENSLISGSLLMELPQHLPHPNRFVSVVSSTIHSVICEIPRLNHKGNRFSGKQQLNAKMWVLDENNVPVDTKKNYELKANYTVIHCINGLDGMYYINIYHVIAKNNQLYGELIYSKVYHKDHWKDVSKEYQSFAEKAVLMI